MRATFSHNISTTLEQFRASLLGSLLFKTITFSLGTCFCYAAMGEQSDDYSISEEVIVTAKVIDKLGLTQSTEAAGRLGLTLLETPASVEIIDGSTMRARGYAQITDAVQSLPGVVTGESPAAPSTLSMRGFTRSQITILRDGLWVGPSNMVMRPQNTFNLERVEILRGPSSVINGQGAVAGTVNIVTKSASVDEPSEKNALFSYGRYNTYQIGLGAGDAINDSAWYRVDVSQRRSDGWVDRMDPRSFNATLSTLWQVQDDLTIKLSVDYLDDDLADYWGTPLIPTASARDPMTNIISTASGETIDRATRFRNYNVSDSRAESEQTFFRADLEWSPTEELSIKNTLYRFIADREWVNAEGFVYCTSVVDVCTQIGEIQRYYGYFFVFHDQETVGNRLTAQYDLAFAGMQNKLLGGIEFSTLDFERTRGFRRSIAQAPSDGVDPYDPVPGVYGPLELRGVSPTDIETRALFVEDALQVSERLSLVAALRYDELDLDRKNFNDAGVLEASSFKRDFDWTSWRLGTVFNIAENTVAYAQYSTAKDPVNANIFLVNAGEDFDLTSAKQWEVGLKTIMAGGKFESTIAYFDIERDDVLERIGLDSASSVGGRESKGVEVSGVWAANDQLTIEANAAYTKAEFTPSANFVAFAGNTPPNVPEVTANLLVNYDLPTIPIAIGAAHRYIDDRFGDNANSVTLKSYSLTDVFASWTQGAVSVSARVKNVTDEEYVAWSDVFYLGQTDPSFIYANQVQLGAPRTYEISTEISF